MAATFSDPAPRPGPLLLPHFDDLVLVRGGGGWQLAAIPTWLAGYLGRPVPEALEPPTLTALESASPELWQAVRQCFEGRHPLEGVTVALRDTHGNTHPLLLDLIPSPFPGDPDRVTVKFQEFPLGRMATPIDLEKASFFGLIGISQPMQRVFNKIRLYARSDAPVLITGETGSGKEVAARAVHLASGRADGPFVPVNCTAISESLFESELFGHEKGSFTGALRSHRGRFERADRGTLFLDEIGDLPVPAQAKLLRVLEDGKIEPVGGEKAIAVDVRLVAATNRHLEEGIAGRQFRADLFFRLNALQIHLPPLRERREDLPLLIQHLIRLLNVRYERQVAGLTPEAIHVLQQYQWPGNVRELRNLMERLFAENPGDVFGLRSLKEWYEERVSAGRATGDPNVTLLPHREAIELGMNGAAPEPSPGLRQEAVVVQKPVLTAETLKQAYRDAGGNITQAAAALGIHKATFYRYLKTFGLSRDDLPSLT